LSKLARVEEETFADFEDAVGGRGVVGVDGADKVDSSG
jgi:hypothetical protein